jgi:hypothetical protein
MIGSKDFSRGLAAGHRKNQNENRSEQPTVEFSAPTLDGSNRLLIMGSEST